MSPPPLPPGLGRPEGQPNVFERGIDAISARASSTTATPGACPQLATLLTPISEVSNMMGRFASKPVMHAPPSRKRPGAPVLEGGSFIGNVAMRADAAGFVFSRMSGSVPAAAMQRHSHEEAYFFFVIEGAYATEAQGAPDARCLPGAVIFNPAGTTHRDHFVEPGGQFLAVGVPPEHAERLERRFEVSTVLVDPHPLSTLLEICRELQLPDATSPASLEGLGYELLAVSTPPTVHRATSPPSWLVGVRERLHEEWRSRATVTTLAKEVGVHPVHLARSFRYHFGSNPATYVRARRLQHARRLLSGSSLPLSEVALDAGFYDHSQFARAFKQTAGVSASEYRRLFGPRR